MMHDRDELNPFRVRDNETLNRYGKEPDLSQSVKASAEFSPDDLRHLFPEEDDAKLVQIGKIFQKVVEAGAGQAIGSASLGGSPGAAEAAGGKSGVLKWLSDNKDIIKPIWDLGESLIDAVHTSPEEQFEQDIFTSRRERLLMMRRHAMGDFTPAERQRVLDANEDLFDRISSTVAARGLSQSGIGQQILSQAMQQPFTVLQEMAYKQLDDFEYNTYRLFQEMQDDDSGLMQDLKDLAVALIPDPLVAETESGGGSSAGGVRGNQVGGGSGAMDGLLDEASEKGTQMDGIPRETETPWGNGGVDMMLARANRQMMQLAELTGNLEGDLEMWA